MTNVFIKEHCRMKLSLFRRIRGQKAPRSERGSAETFGQAFEWVKGELLSAWHRPLCHEERNISAYKTTLHRHVDTTEHIVCQACVNARGPYKILILLNTLSNMMYFVCITSDRDDFIQQG